MSGLSLLRKRNNFMKYDYNQKNIVQALKKIGIKKNDVIFCHSDISLLGIPDCNISDKKFFNFFLKSFFKVLGKGGTVIIPTFTYSFTNKKIYDPLFSKTICGFLSASAQKHILGKLYLDPNLSCVIFGKMKNFFSQNPSKNSYDEKSLFARFFETNGKICNINLDAGSTFLHYLERKLNVIYRFDKTFFGKIKINNIYKKTFSTIFVKNKNNKKETSFKKFTLLAKNNNFYKKISLGKGFIGAISAYDCYSLLQKQLTKNSSFLFK